MSEIATLLAEPCTKTTVHLPHLIELLQAPCMRQLVACPGFAIQQPAKAKTS